MEPKSQRGYFPPTTEASPNHLILDVDRSRAVLSWITTPALSDMLSKLSSLEIYSAPFADDLDADNSEILLKRLLASVPNITHLTFRWHVTHGALFEPDLSSYISLRTLDLQLVCEGQSHSSMWLSCRAWLHRSTHGLPPSLKRVQVTMDLNVTDMSFEEIDAQAPFNADEGLCREGLTVETRVGMFDKSVRSEQAHTAEELTKRGWSCVQSAFSLCQGRQSFVASVKAGRWL